MTRRHVVQTDNGWAVKAEGSKRASSRHATQADAEAAAKRLVGRNGRGEVVIHRPNGRIRDSDTVGPGNDPNPHPATAATDRRHAASPAAALRS